MEATLKDGVPVTAGWFVVNARDVPWFHNDLRSVGRFGGEGEAHFDDLGIALYALQDGQAMSMYHREAGQEDFLVLRGAPAWPRRTRRPTRGSPSRRPSCRARRRRRARGAPPMAGR
jgi:hypothetical protein